VALGINNHTKAYNWLGGYERPSIFGKWIFVSSGTYTAHRVHRFYTTEVPGSKSGGDIKTGVNFAAFKSTATSRFLIGG
jgi:hypothetical protein